MLSLNIMADGTKPVDSGAVIRGITLAGPSGAPGTTTGKNCDFRDEDVDQAGQLTGASVNCLPKGTQQRVLNGLPQRFNAYCIIGDAKYLKSARLIQSPIPDNQNHCDLSAIKPNDAQGQFGGAIWR